MIRTIICMLALLWVGCSLAYGEELKPSPISYQLTGVVDKVNLTARKIVINDMQIQLSPTVEVFDSEGKVTTSFALSPGVQVACALANGSNNRQVITKVWVLSLEKPALPHP